MSKYHFALEPSAEDLAFLEANKFKEPDYPYVVFKGTFWEVLDTQEHDNGKKPRHVELPTDVNGFRASEQISVVNVDGCHCQVDYIRNKCIDQKGWHLIAWGNFIPDDSERGRLYGGSNHVSPWKKLDESLRAYVTKQEFKTDKLNVTELQLAEAKQRIKELEESAPKNQRRVA